VALTLRQHLLAVVVTLVTALAAMLWLTDRVVLAARHEALNEQLGALETMDNAVLLLSDLGEKDAADSALLDEGGHWQRTADGLRSWEAVEPRPAGVWQVWDQAPEVVRSGYAHGMGTLPWVDEEVLWAARVLEAPDTGREIVVAWESVRAVRRGLLPMYSLVIAAMLLAFGISAALTMGGARRVAAAVRGFADSSERLAQGDYDIQLPRQRARELDQATEAVNRLAGNLREATAALREEHARLTRLERLERQFVADASHELRAPLTSMRVTLEAWQDGVLRPAEHGEAVTHLLEETKRLGELVRRLLALSRLESGREAPTVEAMSPREAAEAAAAVFRPLPGATIEVAVDSDLPPVQADADALHQVLTNLLENARRYTPAEGRITIWAREGEHGLCLGVTDTGCGIEAEFLPFIWNRFARGAEKRAMGTAGSGLGLAIVKALAEAMGGGVGVESARGAGTSVWCELRTIAAGGPEAAGALAESAGD